jgi:hypothetical protein
MTQAMRSTLILAFSFAFIFAGCELIGDILKVGFWAGILFVVLIVVVIGAIVRMFKRRS